MALDTYANLKTAIRDNGHRNDLSDDLIDDFISQVESELFQKLSLRTMETRATSALTSSSTRFLALPTGFDKMRRMSILDSNSVYYELEFRTPEAMNVDDVDGRPTLFTITSQIEFDRAPDQAYTVEMAYIKKYTGLSSSNTSNDALTNHPQLYLDGCLSKLFKWARDENRADYYESKFLNGINSANRGDRKGKYGAVPRSRIEGWLP